MSRANPRFRRINPTGTPVAPANGVVMYRIIGQIESQLTVNTFMYSGAVNAPTTSQLATLLSNISAGFYTFYSACISQDWTCQLETLTVVHRNDIATVQNTAHTLTVGSRAAGHEPTAVAAILNRNTGLKGQHGRGRVSLPGIATADVSGSRLLGGWVAVANVLASKMLLTFTDGANTWTPCIGARGLASPRLILSFANLTFVTVNTLLGTVRRRKIGRGK